MREVEGVVDAIHGTHGDTACGRASLELHVVLAADRRRAGGARARQLRHHLGEPIVVYVHQAEELRVDDDGGQESGTRLHQLDVGLIEGAGLSELNDENPDRHAL